MGTLDPALLRDASLSGGDIQQSVPLTVECWAAAASRIRVGPLSPCAGIVSPIGKLVFVDARRGNVVTKLEWGWGLSNTRVGAGC